MYKTLNIFCTGSVKQESNIITSKEPHSFSFVLVEYVLALDLAAPSIVHLPESEQIARQRKELMLVIIWS